MGIDIADGRIEDDRVKEPVGITGRHLFTDQCKHLGQRHPLPACAAVLVFGNRRARQRLTEILLMKPQDILSDDAVIACHKQVAARAGKSRGYLCNWQAAAAGEYHAERFVLDAAGQARIVGF